MNNARSPYETAPARVLWRALVVRHGRWPLPKHLARHLRERPRVGLYAADEIAGALGVTPYELWPDWGRREMPELSMRGKVA